MYEEEILSRIKSDGITELIFTGHSLGGGIAQVAHLLAKAQGKYSDLSIKTVAFAAPMSIMPIPINKVGGEESNDISKELLDEVGSNSINFVFSLDFVPRAYNNVSYLRDMFFEVLPEVICSLKFGGSVLSWTRLDKTFADRVVNFVLEKKLSHSSQLHSVPPY